MSHATDQELTLSDLLGIFRRRRAMIYTTVLVFCGAASLYCAFSTRRYESLGLIQVQKSTSDSAVTGSFSGTPTTDISDSLAVNLELQTQASILQSNRLAMETIRSLQLERSYDFRPHWSPVGWVMGLISPKGMPDAPGSSLENSPSRRTHALKVFANNLKVKPVPGTRLIEVHYTSSDRVQAAAVVNTLTRALLDFNFQTRFEATNASSKWLGEQLGDLRRNSEVLQAKVVDLQRESGVYSLGSVDAEGREQSYSAVIDTLQQATAAVTAAEQNRILKGAIAKAAETGNAEMLSGLAGNSIGTNSSAMNTSLNMIQSLRQQEALQQAALQEAEAKYGPSYPKIAELQGNIAGLEHSIQMEVVRLKGRAESDYAVARQAEVETNARYEQAKKQADVLNNKAVEYAIVRQEAEQGRTLYEDLLRKVNEAGVLAGLRSSNITVVDPGMVQGRPSKPNVPLYMAVALVGGLCVGCFLALTTDTLDKRVSSIAELEQLHGGMLLGALPRVNFRSSVESLARYLPSPKHPASNYIEAIKSIRSALTLSQPDTPRVILVTSAKAGEGKSTFALHLAFASAQSGNKTLLVDTDLRCGSISERLTLSPSPGLSELLRREVIIPPMMSASGIDNLDILVAGARTFNSADLLASKTMRDWIDRWRMEYDFVVLDSVPVLPVTDAVALNSRADATIMIVRTSMAERAQIERSYSMMRRGGAHQVGLVLNALRSDDTSYYGYYGYNGSASAHKKGLEHDA